MATIRSEFSLSDCREFLRGLQARFYIRGFASECSCQNKPRQNYQCRVVRFESIQLAKVVRTKNLFGVKRLQVIPSLPVPNRKMKFPMRRKIERNTAKEKIQMMVANALAVLLLGREGVMSCLRAGLPFPWLSILRQMHGPALLHPY